MPLRLDSQAPISPNAFARSSPSSARRRQDVEAGGARHHRRRRRARRRGADRIDAEIRSRRSRQNRPARQRRPRSTPRPRRATPRRSTRSSSRATASRPITGARSPTDERFTDRARRRAGFALDRDRGGRALRAGRHRGLSVLGADERRAGQGRRLPAAGHGGAGAGRQTHAAGARRGEARRRRRDLSHRRRAGGGGARLRHRRRSRRSPRSSAPAMPMWRRPSAWCSAQVGIDMIAGPSEVLILADKTGNADWIAADLLAQAEHDASAQSILITDDADARRRGRARRSRRSSRRCRAPRLPARRGAISAPSSRSASSTTPWRWSIGSRPSISRSPPPTPKRWPRRSAMPARSSSARTRRKRSAITSPAPTMCCRPRARRASRRASACSIS